MQRSQPLSLRLHLATALSRHAMRKYWRRSPLQWLRLAMFVVQCVAMGTTFLHTPRSHEGAGARMALLFALQLPPALLALAGAAASYPDYQVHRVAQRLSQLPVAAVLLIAYSRHSRMWCR